MQPLSEELHGGVLPIMLLMNLTQESHFRPLEPMKSSLF